MAIWSSNKVKSAGVPFNSAIPVRQILPRATITQLSVIGACLGMPSMTIQALVLRLIVKLAIASFAGLRRDVMFVSLDGNWLQEYASQYVIFKDAVGALQPLLANFVKTASSWQMKSSVSPSAISPIARSVVVALLVSIARRAMSWRIGLPTASKYVCLGFIIKTICACHVVK